jgi:hypothetical protein
MIIAGTRERGNRQQATGNRQQGTGNREQGVGSRERGTREQGNKGAMEQATGNREPLIRRVIDYAYDSRWLFGEKDV